MRYGFIFCFNGKYGVWKTWKAVESILPTFVAVCASGATLLDCHFADIQWFVVVLFEKSSSLSEVNSLRKEIFTRKTAGMERPLPTAAALEQHTKRAYLQAQIWASSCCPELSPLDPRLSSSLQIVAASGKLFQKGSQLPSCFIKPLKPRSSGESSRQHDDTHIWTCK